MKLNLPRIEKAMNLSARELQKVRKAASESTTASTPRGETRKRLPSVPAASATNMQKHEYKVEVRFD